MLLEFSSSSMHVLRIYFLRCQFGWITATQKDFAWKPSLWSFIFASITKTAGEYCETGAKKTKIGGKKQRKYRKDHVYTINLINEMQSITRYGKNKKKNSLAKRKTRPLRYKFSFVRLNLYSIDSSNIYKLLCRMLVVDTVCGSHIIRS